MQSYTKNILKYAKLYRVPFTKSILKYVTFYKDTQSFTGSILSFTESVQSYTDLPVVQTSLLVVSQCLSEEESQGIWSQDDQF